MLSLSSLASRAVLAQDLDTRELPLHLHMQMDQYRSLRGAFALTSVDFSVAKIDRGKVTEEEREQAWNWFLQSQNARMVDGWIMEFDGENKWSMSRGKKSTTIYVDHIHRAQGHQVKKDIDNMTTHVSKYLKNGKFITVAKTEQLQLNDEMTERAVSGSSLEVGSDDCLTWVQRFDEMASGLAFITTTRAARNIRGGDPSWWKVFLGEWTIADRMKNDKEMRLKQEQLVAQLVADTPDANSTTSTNTHP